MALRLHPAAAHVVLVRGAQLGAVQQQLRFVVRRVLADRLHVLRHCGVEVAHVVGDLTLLEGIGGAPGQRTGCDERANEQDPDANQTREGCRHRLISTPFGISKPNSLSVRRWFSRRLANRYVDVPPWPSSTIMPRSVKDDRSTSSRSFVYSACLFFGVSSTCHSPSGCVAATAGVKSRERLPRPVRNNSAVGTSSP